MGEAYLIICYTTQAVAKQSRYHFSVSQSQTNIEACEHNATSP